MRIDTFAMNGRDGAALGRAFAAWLAQGGTAPDFVALHQAVPSLGAGLAALVPSGALHGATSCLGVMSQDGAFIEAGAGAFAIWDPEGDYGTALAPLGDDAAAAAAEATRAALAAAGRPGEAPDLVWLSAAPGREEAILAGIERVVGRNVPILGGSAADDTVGGAWQVFDRQQTLGEGVAVSVLFPSAETSAAYHSGYVPTGHEGTVTAAEGRRLREIDHRPAAEVYGAWTGAAVLPAEVAAPSRILSESTLRPLGRYLESVGDVPYYLLAHPAAVHPDGSLDLFADVAPGDRLTCMTGSIEGLCARAGKVAALAAAGSARSAAPPAGLLMVYCGGCMFAVRDRLDDVVEGVRAAVPGVPFLGVFTFGEQGMVLDGRNRHGNLMISAIVFGA